MPRTGSLRNNLILLTDLDAGRSKNGVPTVWHLVRAQFLVPRQQYCSVFTWQKGWGIFPGIICIAVLIPFMRALDPSSNHFPKVPPQILSHWGLNFNIWLLGGHQHSVYSTNQSGFRNVSINPNVSRVRMREGLPSFYGKEAFPMAFLCILSLRTQTY